MSTDVAFWDWLRHPIPPAATLTVCAPEILRDSSLGECGLMFEAGEEGQRFVVTTSNPARAFGTDRHERPWAIPALYAETQADLDGTICRVCMDCDDTRDGCKRCNGAGRSGGIRDLLAVQAPRRALVLTPREAIDLMLPNLRASAPREIQPLLAVDIVIVAPPTGSDAWPMHTDWVHGVRDQCAAAGVPFVFLGHGEWAPFYDRDKDDPDWRRIPRETKNVTRRNLAGGLGFHGDRVVYFRRVGPERSGRLLDGVEHAELPAWAKEGG